MSKLSQGILIVVFFIIFIVNPNNILPPLLDQMYVGIIHPNSLLFIVFVAIVLNSSIDKDIKQANKKNINSKKIKETIDALEQYFEDKITLQEIIEKSKENQYISKIIHIIKYGGTQEDLLLGIEKIFTDISSKYIKLKNDYEYLSTIMPIVGMIGTIAGLLTMFAVPDATTSFENKFLGLSIALATTLYSSFFTILIFTPKARSVEEWLVDLETDYEYLSISTKQFFHKVDISLLTQLLEEQNVKEQK